MDGSSTRGDGHGDRDDPGLGRAFAGIDHVGVLVHDIGAALPFYLDRLGARLVEEQTLDEVGVRLAYVDAGNTLIQLVQPTRHGPLSDELATRGEGLHHVCFAVEDIPAALARLAPGAAVDVVLGGRGRRACFLPERPHGLRVELTELRPWGERQAAGAVDGIGQAATRPRRGERVGRADGRQRGGENRSGRPGRAGSAGTGPATTRPRAEPDKDPEGP